MRSSSSIVVQGGFLVYYIVIGPVGGSLRIVIAGRARGQQEGLQYSGKAAWQVAIVIYCISASCEETQACSSKEVLTLYLSFSFSALRYVLVY
jgi:hypothetical protein